MIEPERFVCRPRGGAEVRLTDCYVEHRIASIAVAGRALASCAQCTVGAEHAQLTPARRWPNGDRVVWIGEVPPELAVPVRDHDRKGLPAGRAPGELVTHAPLYAADPCVRVEPRRLRMIRGGLDDQMLRRPAEPDASGSAGGASTVPPIEAADTEEEQPMPRPNVYEYQGQERSLAELLALPGTDPSLNANAVRMRIGKGWPLDQALTVPLGAARGTGAIAPAKRATKKTNGHATKKRTPPPAKSAPAIETAVFRVVCFAADVEIATGEVSPQEWASLVQRFRARGEG